MSQIFVKEGFNIDGELFITNETFTVIREVATNYRGDSGLKFAVTVEAKERYNKKRMSVFFHNKAQFVMKNDESEIETDDGEEFVYMAPKAETDDEVEIRINRKFDALKKLTCAVASGHVRSLAAAGSPGTGKTYSVLKMLHNLEKTTNLEVTLLKGTISPVCLYATLWNARESNNVVVLDDCDILGEIDAANMMKAAMDTTKKRLISYTKLSSYLEENGIPPTFEFEGGIIYLSNVDFEREVERKTKMSTHYEAFLSRAHFISTVMSSNREKLIWVNAVVGSDEFKKEHNINEDQTQRIQGWLKSNADTLREVSIRTAVKIADLMKAMPEWYEIAQVTLCRG